VTSDDAPCLAWPYPEVIAHRGAGLLAPENTLAALRLAASLGQRMVEFDVKLTADGEAVLLHDDTLDRTTDGRGPVASRTLASLRTLDAGAWRGASFAGERIPTLDAVIDLLRVLGLDANVELKPCPGRARETGARVTALLRDRWPEGAAPPLVSSFSPEALEASREVASSLPRALLVDAVTDAALDRAVALGCAALDVNHRALDEAAVARVKSRGLRVLVWTVNDTARAAALRSMGVDGVITDAVDVLRPVEREGERAAVRA
jgi:glycerophosphoryl diester phosphodiesterase